MIAEKPKWKLHDSVWWVEKTVHSAGLWPWSKKVRGYEIDQGTVYRMVYQPGSGWRFKVGTGPAIWKNSDELFICFDQALAHMMRVKESM